MLGGIQLLVNSQWVNAGHPPLPATGNRQPENAGNIYRGPDNHAKGIKILVGGSGGFYQVSVSSWEPVRGKSWKDGKGIRFCQAGLRRKNESHDKEAN